ncbi:MAG: pimeloyl-ACP methyl ester carboxylesterase [Phycisphaerales bacterium]|jgi:pimeloyl-ACP methyl ester carboxylesterase
MSHCFIWLCLFVCTSFADEVRIYTGSIEVPSLGSLEMSLGVAEGDEGTYLLLTVPTQGAQDMPLNATYMEGGVLFAELPQAGLSFEVKENKDQSKLTGVMHQGLDFSIDFVRVEALPTLDRPQNPQAPFPYTEREVTVLHPDNFLLQGTLTIPDGKGPFPCAVMISGSGPQDRDETLMGHKPFLVIADYLSRIGIAVLRYDDRGVGGSVMEDYELLRNATSVDFATDAALMVHAARLHPEIDARRVGVIGHSEGGLIGPMVAVKDEALDFVVMLAGPGVPGDEILLLQQALLLQTAGATEEQVDRVKNASLSMYEMMEAGASDEEVVELMLELVLVQAEIQGIVLDDVKIEDAVDAGLEQMYSPWMQYFLFYDPVPTLTEVDCPILAMNGTLDLQVDANQNLPAIATAVEEAGGDLTIVELENLNHLFQPATTGAISEYGQIEITFDQEALDIMGAWLLEVTDDD